MNKMSLLNTCSYIPEMLLDAPKEIKEADAVLKIRDCVGVAFLRMYRMGCIVTIRGGSGIVLKKKEDGSWSAPVAVNMFGPALGASIGVQLSEFILFFKTEEALDGFVSNAGSVGVNGSLAAGPIGREGEALITTKSKEGILAFSNTKGLYGGVSLEFSGVLVDRTANRVQYGRPITPQEIFDTEQPPKGEIFDKMYAAINDLATAPLESEQAPTEAVASN